MQHHVPRIYKLFMFPPRGCNKKTRNVFHSIQCPSRRHERWCKKVAAIFIYRQPIGMVSHPITSLLFVYIDTRNVFLHTRRDMSV